MSNSSEDDGLADRVEMERLEWADQQDADDSVRALDAIDADDPERAHGEADRILLAAVHPDIAAAHARLVRRARWWATA